MRLIYVDEAGTGPAEPVRVVAAIIVNGDDQVRPLILEIEKIFDERVPSHLREGFNFHGLEVFNGGKKIKREDWSFKDRLDFFKEILRIPIRFDLPIALSIRFNGCVKLDSDSISKLKSKNITLPMVEHAQAFSECLEKSDLFLRNYLKGKEIGIVIAEDVPQTRKLLQKTGMQFRSRSLEMPGEFQMPAAWELALGVTPKPYTFTIEHIIDVPHFVDKSSAPLLQIADACAFAFRRFLSRQSHGQDLCLAMLGNQQGTRFVTDQAWFTGLSSGLFNTRKYWSDEQKEMEAEMNARIAAARFINTIFG